MRKFSADLAESFPINISVNLDEGKIFFNRRNRHIDQKVLVLIAVTLRE